MDISFIFLKNLKLYLYIFKINYCNNNKNKCSVSTIFCTYYNDRLTIFFFKLESNNMLKKKRGKKLSFKV